MEESDGVLFFQIPNAPARIGPRYVEANLNAIMWLTFKLKF